MKEIKNGGKAYKHAFSGKDAVTWLLTNSGPYLSTRKDATLMAKRLMLDTSPWAFKPIDKINTPDFLDAMVQYAFSDELPDVPELSSEGEDSKKRSSKTSFFTLKFGQNSSNPDKDKDSDRYQLHTIVQSVNIYLFFFSSPPFFSLS